MSVSKEKLNTLKQKIIEVFDDVPFPALIAPHECDECFELEETFNGKDWRTIEPEILEGNFANLSLFSSEAFHYFLPAYLVYSLNNFNDNLVCEFTIYALTPEEIQFVQYKFKNFNRKQLEVIYAFLDLVKAKKDDNFDWFHEQVEKGKNNLKDFIEPIVRE